MIQRVHETGVNVQVGIDLDGGNAQTHALEEGAGARGNDALADTRDHTTRNNNVFGHGTILEKVKVENRYVMDRGRGCLQSWNRTKGKKTKNFFDSSFV